MKAVLIWRRLLLQLAARALFIALTTAGMSMADAEKQVILFTLENTGGNKTKASEILKIGRKTLHRKLAEYGIGEYSKR